MGGRGGGGGGGGVFLPLILTGLRTSMYVNCKKKELDIPMWGPFCIRFTCAIDI